MIAGIVGLVVIPWIGTFLVVGLATLFEPDTNAPAYSDRQRLADPHELAAVYAAVEAQPQRWVDPAWRKQMEAELVRLELRVFLQSNDGKQSFELPDPWGPNSAASGIAETRPTRELLVYADGSVAGKAVWFSTRPEPASEGRQRPGSPEERQALYRLVESQADRWSDPAWQTELGRKLAPLNLRVELRLPTGHNSYQIPPLDLDELPRVGIWPFYSFVAPTTIPERETAVYQHGQAIGIAEWSTVLPPVDLPSRQFQQVLETVMPPVVIGLILLTIWLAIHLAHRAVLRPLGVLSSASRQIQAGDLEFAVPASPIAEVNQFAQAFEQMRQGLKESIAQQAAMEQDRRLFIAALAHDLRTPLTSVRGYLEGLRDGVARTPERMERYVAVALEKTESLERLIESLFAFARTEYLEQPPQLEQLQLVPLLQRAVDGMMPRAQAKQMRLELDGADCSIRGDRLMLFRVIDNLLDNAIRYTPPAGRITVGWHCESEQVLLWVHDSGPGIPAEDLTRIFEPHFRGDKARGSRTGGAGLGLAIVRRLVEAHGGSISVTNENGARFVIRLPH